MLAYIPAPWIRHGYLDFMGVINKPTSVAKRWKDDALVSWPSRPPDIHQFHRLLDRLPIGQYCT